MTNTSNTCKVKIHGILKSIIMTYRNPTVLQIRKIMQDSDVHINVPKDEAQSEEVR